ncbi:DUF5133 domain-containing protein [Streptomyces cucumeris]|uniref:DUF5133 domain-containing protein n=1 Tax=Streptomyces cucumeris TaxID=2962890 RepID=UPI0020C89EC2|nr:DUF5133 domain-containing protein [Streptomyces sp. NEAU-Y11]MCP9211771.1 DUF5133 domain-containing protein [Streptomyces sp. NEAU-Y11]
MLMAHPAVLTDLVAQYEALRALEASAGDLETQQRLDDVSYTLCVATGTQDVDTALTAARHQLLGARAAAGSLLTADAV